MELPNPNSDKPFDRIIKDHNDTPLWGIRNEHTPEEEFVNLFTQESNQKYWKPELIFSPEGCKHEFGILDLNKREVICKCGLQVIFHISDIIEKDGKATITVNKKRYPLFFKSQ